VRETAGHDQRRESTLLPHLRRFTSNSFHPTEVLITGKAGGGVLVKLLFYGVYVLSLLCVYAVFGYALGIKSALWLFGTIQVSCFLLLGALCWNDRQVPVLTTVKREETCPHPRAFDFL
jgi:hypothetical protein